MWTSAVLAFVALGMLIIPLDPPEGRMARRRLRLPYLFRSGLRRDSVWSSPVSFPSPLETITEYVPTGTEIAITLGVWAVGFLDSDSLLQDFCQRAQRHR